jgi:hypothetical protein
MACLKFKHKNTEYKSKEWDFKAMCIVNEKHCDDNVKGPLMACSDAVDYMFDGTDGADLLNEIAPGVRARLCTQIWEMYLKELTGKNE